MVALKRLPHRPDPEAVGVKQERRGGIETALHLSKDLPAVKKQERRGGIETSSDIIKISIGSIGSRNAVMALKPISLIASTISASGSRNAVVALKHRNLR